MGTTPLALFFSDGSLSRRSLSLSLCFVPGRWSPSEEEAGPLRSSEAAIDAFFSFVFFSFFFLSRPKRFVIIASVFSTLFKNQIKCFSAIVGRFVITISCLYK